MCNLFIYACFSQAQSHISTIQLEIYWPVKRKYEIVLFVFNTVWYDCLIFVGIIFSWISLGFLSMIIYKVFYTLWLRHKICSAWFLDIRISTCLCSDGRFCASPPIYISYHVVIMHTGVGHRKWTRCVQFTHENNQATQVYIRALKVHILVTHVLHRICG